MIMKSGICHQTFASGFLKREKHFVFMKTFYQFGSFPQSRSHIVSHVHEREELSEQNPVLHGVLKENYTP